ncbi:MAG: hypothetical protein JW891_08585 [Candidatus Lokiarchaeota archaeon]|nr:hypothetical protein [Candidatus Lokiarchaeota archaeon]
MFEDSYCHCKTITHIKDQKKIYDTSSNRVSGVHTNNIKRFKILNGLAEWCCQTRNTRMRQVNRMFQI